MKKNMLIKEKHRGSTVKEKENSKTTDIKNIRDKLFLSPIRTNISSFKKNIKALNKSCDKAIKIKLKVNKTLKYANREFFKNINYNDYQQLLTEYTNINEGSISWATQLRENRNLTQKNNSPKNKNILNYKKLAKEKPKGIILTEKFNEPTFYVQDLEKYKTKLKKQKRPLSSILNPNFNNIRHLYINKKGARSKEFASSLRNYNINVQKYNKEKLKLKWINNTNYEKNEYLTKFLLPQTQTGVENLKKLEKKMYRPYTVMYKEKVIGSDSIKQKVLSPDKNYTYDGIGEHLNMANYHSNYRVKNTCQAENIFKKGTNSQCLFELGLRNYKSFSNSNK